MNTASLRLQPPNGTSAKPQRNLNCKNLHITTSGPRPSNRLRMAAVEGQPNNTVYIRNLEERVKLPELTSTLTELFSEYGAIVDLVAKKNLHAKGQAFVVFDNVDSATRAIEEIQGFDLYDKPMRLEYARTPSDATVKAKGSQEEYERHRQRRIKARESRQERERQEQEALRQKRGADAAGREDAEMGVDQQQQQPPIKKPLKGAGLKSTSAAGAVVPDEYLPPNNILFLQNFPEDYDVDELSAVFGKFDGFREVRLVPGRRGIAFVEYDKEAGAVKAKEATSGMVLGGEGGAGGKPIKVTFQRK
ncbi:MAG: hypothetical protein M1831_007068 [Alyxoria varia]|nr:MAG: hypothetical protein M1831_007068 [Alyxoria varia]